jgi:hypothetical protein
VDFGRPAVAEGAIGAAADMALSMGRDSMVLRRSFLSGGAAGLAASSCGFGEAFAQAAKPRPDLADVAAGVYDGDVISDARGSSRSDVRVTVVKSGPNAISVTASYRRMPPFTVRLTRAMNTVQQVGTSVVFLLNLSQSPHRLDITVDNASWSGSRSS